MNTPVIPLTHFAHRLKALHDPTLATEQENCGL
jgi:hypothetical protein